MTIAIFIDIPEEFRPEAAYSIENIFFPFAEEIIFVDDPGSVNNFKKRIIYCHQHSPYLREPHGFENSLYVLLEDKTLSYFSSFQQYDKKNVKWINGVPCLFPLEDKGVERHAGHVFPFDIVAASFFFLSCWQEYSINERDWKGRIPLRSTLQFQLGIIRLPIVNLYLDTLNKSMYKLWGEGLEPKPLPGGGPVYVALSHDVDHIDWFPSKYVRHVFKYIIRERQSLELNMGGLFSIVRNLFGKTYIFNKIRDAEMKHGATSTYYLLSYYASQRHKRYSETLIRSLDGTSFEVGHHISNLSIFSDTLKRDRDVFRPLVRNMHGERVHTLAFEVPRLFSQLENEGYLYDNSLMFAEEIGFRTGFSYPHYVFDPFRKKPFDVVAIPLNVMDATLVENKYLSLSDNMAWRELKAFLNSVTRSRGAALSILFHNDFFFINTARRLKMFDGLLMFLVERNIRIGTCRELFFWRKGYSI